MNRKKLDFEQKKLPLGSQNWDIEELDKSATLPKKIRSSKYQTASFLVVSFFKPISIYPRTKHDI